MKVMRADDHEGEISLTEVTDDLTEKTNEVNEDKHDLEDVSNKNLTEVSDAVLDDSSEQNQDPLNQVQPAFEIAAKKRRKKKKQKPRQGVNRKYVHI